MSPQTVFGLYFLLVLITFGFLAKWVVVPWLSNLPDRVALFWLTLPHAFRYAGLIFLFPAVAAKSPPNFLEISTAYVGVTAGILALLALVLLRAGWRSAFATVWLFNFIGTVDLLNMLRHVEANFGAAWYIPTFIAPLLLMAHYLSFMRLFKVLAVSKKPIPE